MNPPQQAEAPYGAEFIHRFFPATSSVAPVLLLLHGTGGDENDLLSLGRALSPQAALLSVRGRVLEGNSTRFFRRFAEGVLDVEDWRLRSSELAEFVTGAVKHYGLNGRRVVAVGFSNGANIATGLLLLHPGLLSGAILLRPMFVDTVAKTPILAGTAVLIHSGKRDPLVSADNAEALVQQLRGAGAKVDHQWLEAGHGLVGPEVSSAAKWLNTTAGA